MKKMLAALAALLVSMAASATNALWLPHDATISLYGEVTHDSAGKIVSQIQTLNRGLGSGPIYLCINSPGGDVLAGMQIIDAIEASARPVYTVDTGEAASMAAFIHAYGAKRYMAPHAVLMYHAMSISPGEDAKTNMLQSELNFLAVYADEMNLRLAQLSGLSVADVAAKEANEWWVLGPEALQLHLVDAVVSLPEYPTHEVGGGE